MLLRPFLLFNNGKAKKLVLLNQWEYQETLVYMIIECYGIKRGIIASINTSLSQETHDWCGTNSISILFSQQCISLVEELGVTKDEHFKRKKMAQCGKGSMFIKVWRRTTVTRIGR